MTHDLTFMANNPSVGGGEVMLVQLAESARRLGLDVLVVAPAEPDETLRYAEAAGFDVVGLPGLGRPAYLRALRAWDRRQRRGPLWCNGPVPVVATAGHRDRVLHLHKVPSRAQSLALRAASRRGEPVLVPSRYLAGWFPGATVLPNWTGDIGFHAPTSPGAVVRLGFLGRLTLEKGLEPLASALADLDRRTPGRYRLQLAGEPTFADDEEQAEVARLLAPVEHLIDRLGWVDRETFFAGTDVAVLPSVAPESFGLVVAEAMASGTPFVTSRAGAIPEVCSEHHPWLVPAGDPRALADAVVAAVGDQQARVAASTLARARWERLYSPAAGDRAMAEVLTGLGLAVTAPATPTHQREAS